jgi:hypothetical protein
LLSTTSGALGEPGDVVLVERQLALDDVEVAERVAVRLEGRAVEHVDEHRAALDVAQELQPRPLPAWAPGDEARDVATVNVVPPASTTPRLGTSVVNG